VLIQSQSSPSDTLPYPSIRPAQPALITTVAIALLLTAGSPKAEEDVPADPPPDPLAPSDASTFSESGYLGGGGVPGSLLTPNRFEIGDFSLSGQASFGAAYDDNVEANDDERDEDVLLTFSPSVRAQSLYARHSLGLNASATAATALKDSTDDFVDWRIGADGRVDLSRRKQIIAGIGYSREVEDDETADAEDQDGDVPIDYLDAELRYRASGDRLGYSLGVDVKRVDFDDGDFDDRDNTSLNFGGNLNLNWSERLTFSAGPSYRRISYDEDVADDGDSRDAERFGFRIGAGYRASRTISARAALGYAQLNFDDAGRDDEDSATASTGLNWAPGHGVNLGLQASRSLGVSIVDDEDSAIRTTGTATVSHRLPLGHRSTLTSSLTLGVSRLSDFDRTDKTLIGGLTYAHKLTEYAFFTSSYRYSQRASNDDDADYYRNLISLGVTLRY
jgi:hypothetical protein